MKKISPAISVFLCLRVLVYACGYELNAGMYKRNKDKTPSIVNSKITMQIVRVWIMSHDRFVPTNLSTISTDYFFQPYQH